MGNYRKTAIAAVGATVILVILAFIYVMAIFPQNAGTTPDSLVPPYARSVHPTAVVGP